MSQSILFASLEVIIALEHAELSLTNEQSKLLRGHSNQGPKQVKGTRALNKNYDISLLIITSLMTPLHLITSNKCKTL